MLSNEQKMSIKKAPDATVTVFAKLMTTGSTRSIVISMTNTVADLYKAIHDSWAATFSSDELLLVFLSKTLLVGHATLEEVGLSDGSTVFMLFPGGRGVTFKREWKDGDKRSTDCVICYNEVKDSNRAFLMPCFHGFNKERLCVSCITTLFISNSPPTCPICRSVVERVLTNTKGPFTVFVKFPIPMA